MNTMIDDYNPQPKGKFHYTMQTTAVMEHSRGVAWTANLMFGYQVIGIIEQDGNGGADRVYIQNPAYRTIWNLAVQTAFDGNEEDATYYMLVKEEEA